ncbi:uncharacterized protein LOC114349344 isoform X2 [Diabrotica virgifera virgifera]|uniref:Uncharacterized protein LOC114349344 isoform X2 n=1 Tax=Diabrotica virgifera virgifera TaxID=50390 RepID=A0A6P7HCZ2_DIAVI|nr:uncharacterized protein LOC114349344 isoform X2 [Diabrotica virgifera virgifera]
MKFLLPVCFAMFIAFAIAADSIEDCKCFAEFKPEKEGDNWLCRGIKNHRIYSCGEEQPPLCRCYKNGKETVLDIGETNCVGTTIYDSLHCAPTSEWNQYYSRHPQRRIVN